MPVRKLFSHVPAEEARAAGMALGLGIVLTGVKFLGYFLTGSTAVFSDALESIVNLAAGAFALYSLIIAHRPADASHPYGHGKIEFLSAGIEGGMILVAGLVGLVKAVDALLLHGPELQFGNLAIGLLLIGSTLVVNGGVGLYLIRIGRRRGSITLEADGHHLVTDAITSLVTIAALGIVYLTKWEWADPLAGIAISLYIAWIGVRLLARAEAGLTDRQDVEDQKLLTAILDAHLPEGTSEPKICSYHKLRHRHAGRFHWVDFHLVVPSSWDIQRGHEVASSIEREIEKALGEGDATAHVEPCISGKCPRCD
jgi:cation diffusion facilitator family transporter